MFRGLTLQLSAKCPKTALRRLSLGLQSLFPLSQFFYFSAKGGDCVIFASVEVQSVPFPLIMIPLDRVDLGGQLFTNKLCLG